MKKIMMLLSVFVLAACAAQPITPTPVPTDQPAEPTQTPAVIVQTVVVTVIPTDKPTEIPSPTDTTVPPTEVPPTATQPPATEASASTATSAPVQEAASGLVTLDSALGGGFFSNIVLTSKILSLRCPASREITFSVTPSDKNISQVDFYYRIEDRATNAVFDWQGPRRMSADANGNYTLVFTGEDVNQNFRKPNAWFDFQVIGLGKSGARVGNSEKIVQQVSYTFECP